MALVPRRPVIRVYELVSGRRWLTRLNELNRTQWLSRQELEKLQRRKLHKILWHAYKYVPYYRSLFDEYSFHPDDILVSMESFERLPCLNKATVQANLELLQTTDQKARSKLAENCTSGSTGRPMVFMQDSNFRDYATADYHRSLEWAGWQLGEPHCYIWGSHAELEESSHLRPRLMNWALNRFVANSWVFSDQMMHEFADLVRKRQPRILFAYVSSVYNFATYIRDQGIRDIKFDSIIVSAEVLHPGQREVIEETFGCRVFNRYATRELGGLSYECPEHNGMHISMENVYLEILKDGAPAALGEPGDVVVTNLNNYGMPFIRYSIDDTGFWAKLESCPCGRHSARIELTEGRNCDQFRRRDGTPIHAHVIAPLFWSSGIRQFQIIQRSHDLILVRIVENGPREQERLERIDRELREALGMDTEIRFEFIDEIPVLNSGKFRYVMSEIKDEAPCGEG